MDNVVKIIEFDSDYGATALSKRFNVTPACITNIMSCRNWGGV